MNDKIKWNLKIQNILFRKITNKEHEKLKNKILFRKLKNTEKW
jgi:hypothetical protein